MIEGADMKAIDVSRGTERRKKTFLIFEGYWSAEFGNQFIAGCVPYELSLCTPCPENVNRLV
jgi:hypothetical protein